MRSSWTTWPDEMRISWPVRRGTAFVVFPLFTGDRVEHEDGSWTPREFTYVEMPTDEALPYFVMECTCAEDLVPRIQSVQAIGRDPQREVRSTDLRRIRLEDGLEQAWLRVTRRPSTVVADTATPAELLARTPAPLNKRKTLRGLRAQNRRKITDSVHEEVARVYRANIETGAPTKAVADHFGIAASTAFLYVKRARVAGVLEPRDGGGPTDSGNAGKSRAAAT